MASANALGAGGSSPRTWGTDDKCKAYWPTGRFIPTHVGNSQCGNIGVCNIAVHPHARGEQLEAAAAQHVVRGSSPRTWGTGSLERFVDQGFRFIPTHVGNS